MTILMREGKAPHFRWRQYIVVVDKRVAIVAMTPAMFGWNLGRVTQQFGADEWGTMAESEIVAWKRHHDDGVTDFQPVIDDEFRAKLIQHAGVL